MARILLTLTALLTAIVTATGCGNEGSAASGATALAPAGSVMYGEATLKPDGDQQAAVEALVEKFPGEGGAAERIRRLLQEGFAKSDSKLSYSKDIEPWLGDEAAFFVSRLDPKGDADGALLIAADDEEKAFAAIDKASKGRSAEYEGTEYLVEDGNAAGVVDGFVVAGTVPAFKAAVDVAGGARSMEDAEAFKRTLADAPKERLGYLYVNSPRLHQTLRRSQAGAAFGGLGEFFKEPLLVTMNATADGVRFETVVSASLAKSFPLMAEGADLVGSLPGDSWLALAQPDLGNTLDQYLTAMGGQLGGRDALEQQFRAFTGLDLQEDVLSWMGDWGIFVRGESMSELGGALIIETSDEAASGRVIDAIAAYARRAGGSNVRVVPLRVPGEGVTMLSPDVPAPVHLFQRDGKVVFAYGDAAAEDALDPDVKLADTPELARAEQALGGDYNISAYLAVDPILALVDSTGAGSSEDWAKAKPYLEPLDALVGGARKDGDKLRSAFGITVD